MTADAYAVLILVVMFAAGAFVNYLLREWPAAKRTLFDADVDEALRVVDDDDPSYVAHPAVKEAAIRRLGDEAEQWLKERSS